MFAEEVALESVTFSVPPNEPPFGLKVGAATKGAPLNKPYTSTCPRAATYTLPFVTTGMANFMACPAPSRAAFVSLSYSGFERSLASHAYSTWAPWVVYWSVRTAQAIPFCAPSEDTVKEAPGKADEMLP